MDVLYRHISDVQKQDSDADCVDANDTQEIRKETRDPRPISHPAIIIHCDNCVELVGVSCQPLASISGVPPSRVQQNHPASGNHLSLQ